MYVDDTALYCLLCGCDSPPFFFWEGGIECFRESLFHRLDLLLHALAGGWWSFYWSFVLMPFCWFVRLPSCICYIAAAFFLHLVPLLLYSGYIAAVSISVSSFCCCRYGAFAYFLVSRRYGYSSVADFRQRGRDETGSQEDDDAVASSNAEEPTPEETTPAAEPVPAPEAAEAAEEVAETEAEPQPPTPRNSTRPRRAASRRVLEQFENLQKEQQQQEGQTREEDEEGLAEGGENIAALIKERDEEDLQLDQDIHSSEEESEAGAEDLMNEADMPLSEILK